MTAPEAQNTKPLSQRLTDMGHLGSAVGHHVINSFTAIVSNIEMLRLRTTPPTLEELGLVVDDIVTTSLDASDVARRLIDFTRPGSTPKLEPTDLDNLISEFVADQRAKLPAEIELQTNLNVKSAPIQCEPEHLCMMLEYLLRNAIEAREEPVLVVNFSTKTDERGWVVIEVKDNGAGMSQSVLKHAVEPFFSTKPGHVGVGLTIANGIWRRHRGTMSISSRHGIGTTIRLCVDRLRDNGARLMG